MQITTTTAPTKKPRHTWKPLVEAVISAAPGLWVSTPLADLPGTSKAQKQTHVIAAMLRNDIRVRTMTENDTLFVQRAGN